MSIRSSGVWCDICNKPILMGGFQPFKVSISPTPMDSCKQCRPLVVDDINYSELPEGPLRGLIKRAVQAGYVHPEDANYNDPDAEELAKNFKLKAEEKE